MTPGPVASRRRPASAVLVFAGLGGAWCALPQSPSHLPPVEARAARQFDAARGGFGRRDLRSILNDATACVDAATAELLRVHAQVPTDMPTDVHMLLALSAAEGEEALSAARRMILNRLLGVGDDHGSGVRLKYCVDGWFFRLAAEPGDGRGEAHLGQTACYLTEVPECNAKTQAIASDGTPVPLRALAASLARIWDEGTSTDFLIPVLIEFDGRRSWEGRFHRKVELRRIIESHLARGPSEGTCGGSHWCLALVKIAAASEGAIDPDLRRRVEDVLRDRVRTTLAAVDDSGRIRLDLMGTDPSLHGLSEQMVIQSHYCEWLVLAQSIDELRQSDPTIRAIRWLIEQVDAGSAWTSFAVRCHAVHSLRLFVGRMSGTDFSPPMAPGSLR